MLLPIAYNRTEMQPDAKVYFIKSGQTCVTDVKLLQASLEHMIEAHHTLAEGFLNRLFALLNWTLTEFTISSQVCSLNASRQPCASQAHA